MDFKNKQNESFKTTCGQTIWRSRNVAVSVCLLRTDPNDTTKLQVAGVKRGSAVTHTGKHCFPCGYLDWDETVPQAAIREVWEETNIETTIDMLDFYELDSDPKKHGQNVSIQFVCFLYQTKEGENPGDEISGKNACQNEVDDVRWYSYQEALELEWAFDHKERLERLVNYLDTPPAE